MCETLTHRRLALEAHLKHVVVFCGEGKLALGCIFFHIEDVSRGVCDLTGLQHLIFSKSQTADKYM